MNTTTSQGIETDVHTEATKAHRLIWSRNAPTPVDNDWTELMDLYVVSLEEYNAEDDDWYPAEGDHVDGFEILHNLPERKAREIFETPEAWRAAEVRLLARYGLTRDEVEVLEDLL